MSLRAQCTCSAEHSGFTCEAHTPERDVAPALLAATFGGSPSRRAMLRRIGQGTALAVLSKFLPIASLEALAAEGGPPEKKELTVGFVPIVCSTPLILAESQGLFAREGLDVELVRTPSWAIARDRVGKGEYDASQLLGPIPFAMSLGIGGPATPTQVSLVQNSNGQALVLAQKHKERRDPKSWKGLTFAVPHEFSIHNLLLRHYAAEAGIDPDTDLTIRVVPPPEMVATLRAGVIDGFMAPDPAGQAAVQTGSGFIHLLSAELWDGHPCCGFAVPATLPTQAPNTYLALIRSISRAAAHLADRSNRAGAGQIVAQAKYLNVAPEVAGAVLTGRFEDGLGQTREVPNRVEFLPRANTAMAIWTLTQLRRWNMLKEDPDFARLAGQVFREAESERAMRDVGMEVRAAPAGAMQIMGKNFDPAQPRAFIDSFAIRRT